MIYADANPIQAKNYENLLRQRRTLEESKWKFELLFKFTLCRNRRKR